MPMGGHELGFSEFCWQNEVLSARPTIGHQGIGWPMSLVGFLFMQMALIVVDL